MCTGSSARGEEAMKLYTIAEALKHDSQYDFPIDKWVKHSDAMAEIAEYKTKWMDAENANTKQAHEIAELRKGLQSIANNTCCDRCQEASLVAKTTLEKNDG